MAQVIKLFPESEPVSCLDCVNVLMGSRGLFCWELREEIVNASAAHECEYFEE